MSLIAAFGQTYAVNRFDAGAYDGPRWVTGAPTSFNIVASIQPVGPGKEGDLLPEGDRTKDAIRIYTETELRVSDSVAGTKGDQIDFRDRTYEVRAKAVWTPTDIPHFKFIAVMIQK